MAATTDDLGLDADTMSRLLQNIHRQVQEAERTSARTYTPMEKMAAVASICSTMIARLSQQYALTYESNQPAQQLRSPSSRTSVAFSPSSGISGSATSGSASSGSAGRPTESSSSHTTAASGAGSITPGTPILPLARAADVAKRQAREAESGSVDRSKTDPYAGGSTRSIFGSGASRF